MTIIPATTPAHIKIASDLFREYQQFLDVDLCFQGFEDELTNLPGKYAEPSGAILLAELEDEIVGCVALRFLKDKTCEMKRLYVRPQVQGHSLGRLLAEAIIKKAKQLGYKKMQLDTLQRLDRAIGLYEKLGFREVQPHYSNPLDEVVYWELGL